jgi:S-adenosylmethionine/arginine decarboxylase-like enzyme
LENCFGIHYTIDVRDCDENAIKDPDLLETWVKQLVKDIDMIAYGEPQIVHFAKHDIRLSGWTVVQLIETSNIIAHFNDYDSSGCIDVFSCKEFLLDDVEKNLKKFFNCKLDKVTKIVRLENRF